MRREFVRTGPEKVGGPPIVIGRRIARLYEARFKEYGTRLADLADLVREGLQMSHET